MPGHGVMILGPTVQSDGAALVRCTIRTENPYASVTIATVDQSPNIFVSTTTPDNGEFFVGGYKRLTTFCVPGGTSFQAIIQIMNTSSSDTLIAYLDNFEIIPIERDKYYSGDFLDGDENDPETIRLHPGEEPTITPTFTPTPEEQSSTPTATPTATPSSTPLSSTTPSTPTLTFTPTSTATQSSTTPTPTFTPTSTATPETPTPTGTLSPTPTGTPTPTPGETETLTIDLPGLAAEAKPLEMVLIEAGAFVMGSPTTEVGRYPDETQHQVTLTQDFYIGKYEVTQGQWKAVMGENPSYFHENPNLPVEQVSWEDCQAFIEQLNEMGAGTFRLPTEAEWEYACRAGTTERFYWGDDPEYNSIDNYAWYNGNNEPVGTKIVGLKSPNAWGLFDVSGNVREWCQDWYTAYPSSAQEDPVIDGAGTERVIRGGGWNYAPRVCRSAVRFWYKPDGKVSSIGFRVVRTP